MGPQEILLTMCFLAILCLRVPKAIPEPFLSIVANKTLDPFLFIRYTKAPSYLIPWGYECLRYATVTDVRFYNQSASQTSYLFGLLPFRNQLLKLQ